MMAERKARIGLVVAFAALSPQEDAAVHLTWAAAHAAARHWEPAGLWSGLEPLPAAAESADLLVYLGESSRFSQVAGTAAAQVPVVLVKSTVEALLERPFGAAPRYRMCTGVDGIAQALAKVAPEVPSVDWQGVPWTQPVHLDDAEAGYVANSAAAFKKAMLGRGLPWLEGIPAGGAPFSVFLTMHDPSAANLAAFALHKWQQCTVLAADGMVATSMPNGEPWPDRLLRVRHWTMQVPSDANQAFTGALNGQTAPDFDSAGMVFGTMNYLDAVCGSGGSLARLEDAGRWAGPLGLMAMTASGRPDPERIVVWRGAHPEVVEIA